jgi:hypothetical protein
VREGRVRRGGVTQPSRNPAPAVEYGLSPNPMEAEMPETTERDLYALLLDRLRHSAQYAEACRVTLEDAIALIEEAQREEKDDG